MPKNVQKQKDGRRKADISVVVGRSKQMLLAGRNQIPLLSRLSKVALPPAAVVLTV